MTGCASRHTGPRPDLGSWPRLLGRLTRWRLALAVAATGLAGEVLAGGCTPASLTITATGIALLAAAASAGNQVQERDLDGRMRRTCHRPLPTGRLSPRQGLGIALGLGAGGLLLLGQAGWQPVLLGAAALGCYNGLYTPLKRRTPLALLPGALCGALPPLIGWTAAGGAIGDYRILLVATLVYLWQLPHFWRLADRHAEDYRRAGLPVLQEHLGPQLATLARLAWTLALAAAMVLLPLFGLLQSFTSRLLVGAALLVLLFSVLPGRRPRKTGPLPRGGPAWADLCLVLLLLLLLGERLLAPAAGSALNPPGLLAAVFPG